jgi:hypothetical protein
MIRELDIHIRRLRREKHTGGGFERRDHRRIPHLVAAGPVPFGDIEKVEAVTAPRPCRSAPHDVQQRNRRGGSDRHQAPKCRRRNRNPAS